MSPQPDSVTRWQGTPVVPGAAYAPALVARRQIDQSALDTFRARSTTADEAIAAYDTAVTVVADALRSRAEKASGAAAEVLTATAGLARDKGLRAAVAQRLNSGQVNSGRELLGAVDGAVEQFAGLFAKMGGLMAERVTDLRDIGVRVTARLVGEPEPGVPTPTEPSIVVAEDLAPADTALLDPALVVGLVTSKGGPTSHTAIIARQLGIPCVVAAAGVTEVTSGATLLLNATVGEIRADADVEEAHALVAADLAARAAADDWVGPAETADGTRVKVLANVADGPSALEAAAGPVEGVGLFRTELCFLDCAEEPTAEEQTDIYSAVLEPFRDRYVVVRTLDAGSDKPVAFATLDDEENPALGVRGLRLSFDNPGLLERQLDAIGVAAKRTGTETWVMAPMVATLDEAAGFAAQARSRGLKAGVMVEIPSAALLAEQMLQQVDFLSIGTNDLTQYTMAADRLAADLAHLTDPWQPAVLHLIALTAQAGQRAGKPVGVCGEAAADPHLGAVLVGMGITSLSMASAAVRPVGAQIGAVSLETCRGAADAALAAPNPKLAREAARAVLEG